MAEFELPKKDSIKPIYIDENIQGYLKLLYPIENTKFTFLDEDDQIWFKEKWMGIWIYHEEEYFIRREDFISQPEDGQKNIREICWLAPQDTSLRYKEKIYPSRIESDKFLMVNGKEIY